MRAIPVILVAVSVTTLPHAAAGACDNDRYPCEPRIVKLAPAADAAKPVSSAARTERKSASQANPVRQANEEKVPPDDVQALPFRPKPVSFWQPIDIPSQAIQPSEIRNTTAEPRDPVRVVSAEEINEVDLAALSQEPVRVTPVRVVWPEPPAPMYSVQQATSTPAAPAPADTSLLERVMLTFGGAFGAASALRMFLG